MCTPRVDFRDIFDAVDLGLDFDEADSLYRMILRSLPISDTYAQNDLDFPIALFSHSSIFTPRILGQHVLQYWHDKLCVYLQQQQQQQQLYGVLRFVPPCQAINLAQQIETTEEKIATNQQRFVVFREAYKFNFQKFLREFQFTS